MRHTTARPVSLLAAVLTAAVIGAAACGGTARSGAVPLEELEEAEAADARAPDRPTRVVVENESGWSLRVYALVGGAEYYLGSVAGYDEASFELNPSAARATADFRLAAKATGTRANYYSNVVLIEEGDTVRWTVLRSFSQTRATIRVS